MALLGLVNVSDKLLDQLLAKTCNMIWLLFLRFHKENSSKYHKELPNLSLELNGYYSVISFLMVTNCLLFKYTLAKFEIKNNTSYTKPSRFQKPFKKNNIKMNIKRQFFDLILNSACEMWVSRTSYSKKWTVCGPLNDGSCVILAGNTAMSTDDLLPLLVYLITTCDVANWLSNFCYLKRFHFAKSPLDKSG